MEFSRSGICHMKTRACFKYFIHDCLWEQFFASNSSHAPSNFALMIILVTVNSLTQISSKIRATNLQKSTK